MDINDFRGLMSAVILFAFLGLILFTLMGGRDRFRDAAHAPFADDFADDDSDEFEEGYAADRVDADADARGGQNAHGRNPGTGGRARLEERAR